MEKVNFHYKDRLFSTLFGNDQRKGLTLSLYNSLNHTHYTNADDLRINTIDDVVYMGMKNDVSFLLACEKCHRLKPLVRFATCQNSSIS